MSDSVQQDPQDSSNTGKRDHVLRNAIEVAVVKATSPEEIAECMLQLLDERRLIQYAPKGTMAVLSAPGRVLLCLIENPGSTIREISVRLGITEANVGKSIATLAEHNVIARTKVKNKYVYNFNAESIRNHPDIRRFHEAISPFFTEPN